MLHKRFVYMDGHRSIKSQILGTNLLQVNDHIHAHGIKGVKQERSYVTAAIHVANFFNYYVI